MATPWVYQVVTAQAELSAALGHPATQADMQPLWGRHGAAWAELAGMGLPVPPGFILSTAACMAYLQHGAFPDELWPQVLQAVEDLQARLGKRFGDATDPLLVSVCTSHRHTFPGMLGTILNVGLNDTTCAAFGALMHDPRAVCDIYRRFIVRFATTVMGADSESFQTPLPACQAPEPASTDAGISLQDLWDLIERHKALYRDTFGVDFPTDPYQQLKLALEAVFRSWDSQCARNFRRAEGLPDEWGVAAEVWPQIAGNFGDASASGYVFSRNPVTGAQQLFGEYIPNGTSGELYYSQRPALNIEQLRQTDPRTYARLSEITQQVEAHYREMQKLDFVIEQGQLWLMSCYSGQRSARAAIEIAVDLAAAGLISKTEAVLRVTPQQVEQESWARFCPHDTEGAQRQAALLARGIAVAPGTVVGRLALGTDTAKKWAQDGVASILAIACIEPEHLHGILAAQGVLVGHARLISAATTLCWPEGKPVVTGLETLAVDLTTRTVRFGERIVHEGETISVDGNTGEVFAGDLPRTFTVCTPKLQTLLEWAEQLAGPTTAGSASDSTRRRLAVWANADYVREVRRARQTGAQGVGLNRTEHLFFRSDAPELLAQIVFAPSDDARKAALAEMQELQEQDFEALFEVADGLPLVIRLLDPPLCEFFPSYEDLLINKVTPQITEPDSQALKETTALFEKLARLHEQNPGLGVRGCRMAILHPELVEMQTRALFRAACRCVQRGIVVQPRLLLPMVSHVNEVRLLRERLNAVIQAVLEEAQVTVDYRFGVMIETPRAALTASEIAPHVEFLSLDGYDLTQLVYGLSHEDVARELLPAYIQQQVFSEDPFKILDQSGVGRLLQLCVADARAVNPRLEIGLARPPIARPETLAFCQRLGLDYVSCPPFMVLKTRLMVAQSVLQQPDSNAV